MSIRRWLLTVVGGRLRNCVRIGATAPIAHSRRSIEWRHVVATAAGAWSLHGVGEQPSTAAVASAAAGRCTRDHTLCGLVATLALKPYWALREVAERNEAHHGGGKSHDRKVRRPVASRSSQAGVGHEHQRGARRRERADLVEEVEANQSTIPNFGR